MGRPLGSEAGEGELPFQVGSGYQARVADFRSDERFLTLDYSEGETPQVFLGSAVTLEALKCQLLRTEDQVEDTAGKLKGKAGTLECPNCGSGIDYAPGKADHLICPSCHAEVAANAGQAEVLKKHDELEQAVTSLQLGDAGTLDGLKWQVIGLMRCKEFGSDESSTWTEYLLFNAHSGFLWLVETDEKWTRTVVLNTLPEDHASSARFGGKNYTKQWDYGSEVIYAAGAFNWRVSIGNQTRVTDYQGPDGTLSKEATAEEITWSLSTNLASDVVAKAFGKSSATVAKAGAAGEPSPLGGFAKIASGILIVLNLGNIFRGSIGALIFTGLALLLLWLPVWMSGASSSSSDSNEGDDE